MRLNAKLREGEEYRGVLEMYLLREEREREGGGVVKKTRILNL